MLEDDDWVIGICSDRGRRNSYNSVVSGQMISPYFLPVSNCVRSAINTPPLKWNIRCGLTWTLTQLPWHQLSALSKNPEPLALKTPHRQSGFLLRLNIWLWPLFPLCAFFNTHLLDCIHCTLLMLSLFQKKLAGHDAFADSRKQISYLFGHIFPIFLIP